MELESWSVRVVPLVSFDVVVFAGVQLNLIVAIVAAESINDVSVENCWEEGFLGRHLSSYFYFAVGVLEACITGTLSTKHKPAFQFIHVEHRDHRGESITVGSSTTPLERNLLLNVNTWLIKLLIWILQEHLVSACQLELLNLKRHLADSATSVFEPHSVRRKVAVQIILLRIRLEKFSLRQEIIVCFHLILHVDLVLILNKFTLATTTRVLSVDRLCHTRRYPDKVLVRLRLLHLLWR
jgi:hypothetical protein